MSDIKDAKGKRLAAFLREVSNWNWQDFVLAEKNPEYTSNEAIIFALVRACAMQKIDAIKISLNRLDGKLKTPLQVEYPKIFYLYPKAKLPSIESTTHPLSVDAPSSSTPEIVSGELVAAQEDVAASEAQSHADQAELARMSLRETLRKMGEFPRQVPSAIIEYALQTEQWMRQQADRPPDIPRVKSVIAANLLVMAQKRDMNALYEVFDQIEGKLVETIQLLGDDIYITSYSEIAPPGAYVNDRGILQAEATQVQDLWAQKLGRIE